MGISLDRASIIVKSKINKLLGAAENPCEELDYSVKKQEELLVNVNKGITNITGSKNKLKIQKSNLEKTIPTLDNQARQCMNQGNEELAKSALERKNNALKNIKSLSEQIDSLEIEQDKLVKSSKELKAKIEQLNSDKEVIKAQFEAAQSTLKIKESLTGINGGVNVNDATKKAKDKTNDMIARSSAIDELSDSGVLTDSSSSGTDIDRELARVESNSQVNSEFKKMKRLALLKKNDLNAFKV